MKNKAKALTASIMVLVSFTCIGYYEIGPSQLLRSASYTIAIASPLMVLFFKYRKRLLNAPKYLPPLGMLIGIVAFKALAKNHKPALVCFAMIVGILLVFASLIYNDEELKQG